ncbi:MAG: trypsin-like peptidase domain-containing protein [Planctomycetota bacterium]
MPRWRAAVVLSLCVAPCAAQEPGAVGAPLKRFEEALTAVIAKAERSVVAIRRYARVDPRRNVQAGNRIFLGAGGQADPLRQFRIANEAAPTGFGAGVVVGPGLVLTQYLAIGIDERHTVTTVDGETFEAELIAADPRSSLAALRVASNDPAAERAFNAPAAALGRAEDLVKGRFVVAIGNPLAIESDGQPTASLGVVTNTARRAPLGERFLRSAEDAEGPPRTTLHHQGALIQTDAKLGWNSAGGALVTLDGELVGVLTTAAAIVGHEAPAGYAIPINRAMRRVARALLEGREPEYGLLGIRFQATPPGVTNGVMISDVYAAGPAGRSGLRKQDVVAKVNGESVVDAASLQLLVGSLAPGDEPTISYLRNGREQTTTVRLGKAYVDGPKVATSRQPSWQGLRVDFPTAVPPLVLQAKVQERRLDPEGCVVVSEVEPKSVAWKMGIRPYVYISHVDSERVSTPQEFYAAVKAAPGTARLKFTKPLTAAPRQPTPRQL